MNTQRLSMSGPEFQIRGNSEERNHLSQTDRIREKL